MTLTDTNLVIHVYRSVTQILQLRVKQQENAFNVQILVKLVKLKSHNAPVAFLIIVYLMKCVLLYALVDTLLLQGNAKNVYLNAKNVKMKLITALSAVGIYSIMMVAVLLNAPTQ